MSSMNQLWKKSGSSLSFKEWLPKHLAAQEAKLNSAGPAPVNVNEMFGHEQSGVTQDYTGKISDTSSEWVTVNNKQPKFHIHKDVMFFGLAFIMVATGIMLINKYQKK